MKITKIINKYKLIFLKKAKLFRNRYILPNKKILVIIASIIIVLSVGFLAKSLFIAAIVNGNPVSRFTLIKELEKAGGNQTLDNLIVKKLIFQEARAKAVSITQEEVNQEVKNIEELITKQGMTLDEALSLQNQTKAELVEQIKLQKTVEKILADKLVVTDDEIAEYFAKNKDLFNKEDKLEDVKDDIKSQLMQGKLTSEYQTWITDLKAKAKIFYFVNF